MSPRSGSRLLRFFQGLHARLHRAGTWVLVLAALILPAGCASQRSMRPPPGGLLSNYRYRPPTPSFLKEKETRDVSRQAGEAEGERALADPSTGFAPVHEGTARLTAHQGPVTAVPQPIALPMPFWARVAALVLLPGTAHAPDQVPECERTRSHKNEHLAGQKHPVTGVLFKDNGYPAFEPIIEITIPEELRGPEVSDARQFAEASRQLREILEIRPEAVTTLTPEQLEAIEKGWPRIPGLTWHHHEDGMTLQLVDRDTHARTGHSGGRETAGGRPK